MHRVADRNIKRKLSLENFSPSHIFAHCLWRWGLSRGMSQLKKNCFVCWLSEQFCRKNYYRNHSHQVLRNDGLGNAMLLTQWKWNLQFAKHEQRSITLRITLCEKKERGTMIKCNHCSRWLLCYWGHIYFRNIRCFMNTTTHPNHQIFIGKCNMYPKIDKELKIYSLKMGFHVTWNE